MTLVSSCLAFCFSGIDVAPECMPNKHAHILFGKLKSLPENAVYRGDRIYIKPEPYGLQQFRHYLGRESPAAIRLCSLI